MAARWGCRGWRSGLGGHVAGPMVQQRQSGKAYPWRDRPVGWNEGYEPAVLWGGGSADCPGLPRPTGGELQQRLGVGCHGSAPGGRRRLRSAQSPRASPPVRSAENVFRRQAG